MISATDRIKERTQRCLDVAINGESTFMNALLGWTTVESFLLRSLNSRCCSQRNSAKPESDALGRLAELAYIKRIIRYAIAANYRG
jgi:hypothetical protein